MNNARSKIEVTLIKGWPSVNLNPDNLLLVDSTEEGFVLLMADKGFKRGLMDNLDLALTRFNGLTDKTTAFKIKVNLSTSGLTAEIPYGATLIKQTKDVIIFDVPASHVKTNQPWMPVIGAYPLLA